MSATPIRQASQHRLRWLLVLWTVPVWGVRILSTLIDDSLTFAEQFRAVLVAAVLITLAVGTAVTMAKRSTWHFPVLSLLVAGGIFRLGVRGVEVLLSGDSSVGFVILQTFLVAVTVILSALAAWEFWQHRDPDFSFLG